MQTRVITRWALALVLAAAPAGAAPPDDLRKVIDEHWAWYLKNNPIAATLVGVHDYDDQLFDLSLAVMDRQADEAAAFIQRLDAIPDGGLPDADRVNKAVLRRMLSPIVDGNRFGQRTMLFTSTISLHQGLADLSTFVPLHTRKDFESYLARLGKVAKLMDEQVAITRVAVSGGFTQPCIALGNFENSIKGVIVDDPLKSRFYTPFTERRPDFIPETEWLAMQARARQLVSDEINAAYRRFAAYFHEEYMPHCRQDIAASALPRGAEYYALQVRDMTTTNLTPDQIHEIGLGEVARIRDEMDALAARSGYASREAFTRELHTDPMYSARTPQELMSAVALQAKVLDGKMPGLVGKLARLPYGLREIPPEDAPSQSTAYYQAGAPEAGIAGTFYVNTSKLDERPLWELPALTLHEAVPGHHHQIALQQELPLPMFRRHAVWFPGFEEGWGLYCERLGIQLGLYDTPEKEMGRLSAEMERAVRLVVDTGMHAKGWSRERAVAFMKENTAMTAANIDAEVNRYITWPAQALAYKIGQLKILDLRARAERELGTRFDLRDFHDAVLGQGAVPLDVLERQVTEWIAARKAGTY